MLTRLFDHSAPADGATAPIHQFFANRRRPLLALAIGTFILFVLHNGERDLWTPDEPRFGQVVKEMIHDGHVFVLHVNGEPYSDKPPLYFYIAAAVALAHGALRGGASEIPAEWIIRLPSYVAAVAGVFLVYWLGTLLIGRRTAFFGAATMALSWTYIWQGRAAQLDMLMSAFIFASLACWARNVFGPNRRARWLWLFYAFAALGTLSKGPPGFIVPFGAAIVYRCWQFSARRTSAAAILWCVVILILQWLAGSEEYNRPALVSADTLLKITAALLAAALVASLLLFRRVAGRFYWGQHAVGWLIFAAILSAWLVPMNLLAPEAHSEDVLLGQTIMRYLNPTSKVESMWTYYPTALLADWFPWTLLLPAAIWAAFRGPAPMPVAQRRFLLSLFFFTFIFFSLSPGKRDQYLLPLWPSIGLLLGYLFDRVSRQDRLSARWFWIPNAIAGAIFLIAGAGALVAHFALEGRIQIEALTESLLEFGPRGAEMAASIPAGGMAVPLCLGGGGLILAAIGRRAMAGYLTLAFTMILLCVVATVFILPAIDGIKSGRAICDDLNRHWRPGEGVVLLNLDSESYVYYGLYRATETDRIADLEEFFAKPGRQWALIRRSDLRQKMNGRINGREPVVTAETYIGGRHVLLVTDEAPEG